MSNIGSICSRQESAWEFFPLRVTRFELLLIGLIDRVENRVPGIMTGSFAGCDTHMRAQAVVSGQPYKGRGKSFVVAGYEPGLAILDNELGSAPGGHHCWNARGQRLQNHVAEGVCLGREGEYIEVRVSTGKFAAFEYACHHCVGHILPKPVLLASLSHEGNFKVGQSGGF